MSKTSGVKNSCCTTKGKKREGLEMDGKRDYILCPVRQAEAARAAWHAWVQLACSVKALHELSPDRRRLVEPMKVGSGLILALCPRSLLHRHTAPISSSSSNFVSPAPESRTSLLLCPYNLPRDLHFDP